MADYDYDDLMDALAAEMLRQQEKMYRYAFMYGGPINGIFPLPPPVIKLRAYCQDCNQDLHTGEDCDPAALKAKALVESVMAVSEVKPLPRLASEPLMDFRTFCENILGYKVPCHYYHYFPLDI